MEKGWPLTNDIFQQFFSGKHISIDLMTSPDYTFYIFKQDNCVIIHFSETRSTVGQTLVHMVFYKMLDESSNLHTNHLYLFYYKRTLKKNKNI